MDFKEALKELQKEYHKELDETPWYHNTGFCQVTGAIDELESLTNNNYIDEDNIGCYIIGRIEVLKELKRRCIFE